MPHMATLDALRDTLRRFLADLDEKSPAKVILESEVRELEKAIGMLNALVFEPIEGAVS